MMRDVFISSDNIVSPIGLSTAENFSQLKMNVSGVRPHADGSMSEQPFHASLFDPGQEFLHTATLSRYTKFEKLLITSIAEALQNSGVAPEDKRTILILSSTKGNISLLETEEYNRPLQERISLNSSAKLIADHFHFAGKPLVVSNACISGLLAILTGMRLIQSGRYDNAVIAGADVISRFVLSGFQSFQAVSASQCKPFDAARDGINLGEGAATMILSSNKGSSGGIKVSGGSVSNDANHISGPSRTGEELHQAISRSMKDAGLTANDIGFISAHGTATVYNDEMEAKAINLSALQSAPVNSLKGYYGHTLGAAGLIESVISIQSMKEGLVIPTIGFSEMGVTQPVNVCSSLYKKEIKHCLKTASGFGGCNAALTFSRE